MRDPDTSVDPAPATSSAPAGDGAAGPPPVKVWTSVVDTFSRVDPVQWDACAGDDPFLKHAFFEALERSGTAGPRRGVAPRYVLVHDASGQLAAGVPAMLKTGTLAEYGPEHLWLKAGLAEGSFAWPKFQAGVPLFPVRGERLLVRKGLPRPALERTLVRALVHFAVATPGVGALNVTHVTRERALGLQAQGWLVSHEPHCFWRNRPHASFDAYVGSLPHRKRYLLNKERRRVDGLGLDIRILPGAEITPPLLDDYYRGHAAVCRRYGFRPWLPLAMYRETLARMPGAVRLIAAFDAGRFVAGIFCMVGGGTLFLRTWSALHDAPGLAFELICYRPIRYAIEEGLALVDSGLIGPHKVQRGYPVEPVFTAHWFPDERLQARARAVLASQR